MTEHSTENRRFASIEKDEANQPETAGRSDCNNTEKEDLAIAITAVAGRGGSYVLH
jgi:hypothetical protein